MGPSCSYSLRASPSSLPGVFEQENPILIVCLVCHGVISLITNRSLSGQRSSIFLQDHAIRTPFLCQNSALLK